MGDKTGISWTDATWNPVRGCSRVSPGCVNCYAEEIAARFSGPGQPYEGLAKRVGGDARWTGKVRTVPEHLADPLRWKRPRRIFVNSMSDLFHEGLSFEEIAAVFGVMAGASQHTFQVLTKRPARALEFFAAVATSPYDAIECCEDAACAFLGACHLNIVPTTAWPLPNVWLGVSVEDQANADLRIPQLLQCPAAVRFVSYEPALGPINFRNTGTTTCGECRHVLARDSHGRPGSRIDWVIVGGESGRDHRSCDPAWFEAVAEQCSAAGVALFVKQDAGPKPGKQGRLSDELWARKEFPRVA